MVSIDNIQVRGAREHNLKNVDLDIPRNQLVVFSGPSGSGKSSLAFDTLFAEGQRRYVESLSTYSRQFLGQLDKPRVDGIQGLCPTISIEEKAGGGHPRSTVGTMTELHDYLRLLFARLGVMHCPDSGEILIAREPNWVSRHILEREEGARVTLLAPIFRGNLKDTQKAFLDVVGRGYSRVRVNGEIGLAEELDWPSGQDEIVLEVVVDRLVVKAGRETRVTDSVETAYEVGRGEVIMLWGNGDEERASEVPRSLATGRVFAPLSPNLFSFNSPAGMCGHCQGLGVSPEIDLDVLVPDATLSLGDGAIATWRAPGGGVARIVERIVEGLERTHGILRTTPFMLLSEDEKRRVLWGEPEVFEVESRDPTGKGRVQRVPFEGAVPALERRLLEAKSPDVRARYSRYFIPILCPDCAGTRLNEFAGNVRVDGRTLPELNALSLAELLEIFRGTSLTGNREVIGRPILDEILSRLSVLLELGLSYLQLERGGDTLSGGEAQRLRLASQVGSQLTGVLYVLDEPSIGLHPRDNERLIAILKRLRDQGNTVLVVEHDLDVVQAADHIVDFGPGAGAAGGQIIAQGTLPQILEAGESLTGQFLSGRRTMDRRSTPRPPQGWLTIRNPRENNLKGEDIAIPRGVLVALSGVSGAGKSTLVHSILYPSLAKQLHGYKGRVGNHDSIDGIEGFDKVIRIDQKPIGRSPRSNPATYTKCFDEIRGIFAQTPESKAAGYSASRFSFNVKGGRCEACKGEGVRRVPMHFLPDVYVRCDGCDGKRFNPSTLRIKYRGYSVSEVLNFSVREALEVFTAFPKVRRVLETMREVGLGYLALGQASSTLSGGEAQRVKLSRELAREGTGKTLYILDEPSTGLHVADVEVLLGVMNRLVDAGNTVLVVEHHVSILERADWILDLGPEGGQGGGHLVASGPPSDIMKCEESITAPYLHVP